MKSKVTTIGMHNVSGKQFAYVIRRASDGRIRPGRRYHPSYRTARLLCNAVRKAADEPGTKVVPDIDGWVYVSW